MNNPCDDCFANGCCHSKGVCGLFQEYLYLRKKEKYDVLTPVSKSTINELKKNRANWN